MKTAKFVTTIDVKDPDTFGNVEMTVFKHEGGGMFAVDSSFLEQCWDDDVSPIVNDPLADIDEKDPVVMLIY